MYSHALGSASTVPPGPYFSLPQGARADQEPIDIIFALAYVSFKTHGNVPSDTQRSGEREHFLKNMCFIFILLVTLSTKDSNKKNIFHPSVLITMLTNFC